MAHPSHRCPQPHAGSPRSWRFAVVLVVLCALPWRAASAAHADGESAGGPTAVRVSPGGLTISADGADVAALAAVTLNSSDQGKTVYLPLVPFTVRDMTGTGRGWHVTIQATPLTAASGATLPPGSLSVAAPLVTCAPGTGCEGRAAPPRIMGAYPVPIDTDTATTIASAAVNTGMGSYIFTPSSFTSNPANNLALAVPQSASPGTYHASLLISVDSGP